LKKQAEEKWYEKAWQKTKDAATVTGAFVEGAATGLKDAAVRDLPGYKTNKATGVQLEGPAFKKVTPHYKATQVQKQRGGGTYGAERRIGYKALRRGGMSKKQARAAIGDADKYFNSLGVDNNTPTRMPGNRR